MFRSLRFGRNLFRPIFAGARMAFFEQTIAVRFVFVPKFELRTHLLLFAENIGGDFDYLKSIWHFVGRIFTLNV